MWPHRISMQIGWFYYENLQIRKQVKNVVYLLKILLHYFFESVIIKMDYVRYRYLMQHRKPLISKMLTHRVSERLQ